MAFGLFYHSVSGVDQNQCCVGGRSTGNHVSGVLNVAWCIGNDEFSLWGGEIPVGHIDSDALFALVTESICEQCQIHSIMALALTGMRYGFQLVFKYGL